MCRIKPKNLCLKSFYSTNHWPKGWEKVGFSGNINHISLNRNNIKTVRNGQYSPNNYLKLLSERIFDMTHHYAKGWEKWFRNYKKIPRAISGCHGNTTKLMRDKPSDVAMTTHLHEIIFRFPSDYKAGITLSRKFVKEILSNIL